VRRSSLRRRTYAVVLAVVLAPLALVAIANELGAGEKARMQAAVERGASAVAEAVAGADEAGWGAAVERAASQAGVRILVIDAGGRTVFAADHEAATSLRDRLGDALFGPEGAPALRSVDDERSAAGRWPEVETAVRTGRSAACTTALSGALLVCHSAVAVAVEARGEPLVVLAQKSSPRAIRALFDLRYPLLKLTLYVLVLGALLAAWLGRRILHPILRLRREVLQRAADPLRASPIPLVSKDEVGDLGEAFNALLGALAALRRENETFAVDLAHELKSPIATVRACADALQRPVDAARAERLARLLADSTHRLDTLVSQFLEIARAEAGLPHEERAALALGGLVRGVCDGLAAEERYAGVRFEVDAQQAEVLGAAGALETALRNVLDNAASFAGDGGWVRARVACEGAAVVVEISDSGPGIPPENLPRVFDRFFTERPAGKGTGLGLAYAKAAIEAHGGTLTVACEPAHGALFTIRLMAVSHSFHTLSANDSPEQ
jgi:signal transduction histidine kinase